MAKRRDAVYQPGRRSNSWWKIKLGRRREFVVGGWSTGQGSRQESIGSLALGVYDDAGQLRYVGQAGSGLSEDLIRQLQRLFAQIAMPAPPFVNPAPPALRLQYVQPLLVVEIAYSEVTEGGTLRQPSIKVFEPTSSPPKSLGTKRSRRASGEPASKMRPQHYEVGGLGGFLIVRTAT